MKPGLLTLSLLLAAVTANAETYHYTGITGTAKIAHTTSARLTMSAYPTQNCSKSYNCFAVGWVLLWDNGSGSSGQYAEAGIGYQPSKCPKATPVKLWYATPQVPGASTVGCVPLGTEVRVSILKEDGQQSAFVTWEYGSTTVTRTISLPGWVTGPGIHPSKVEVYTSSNITKPYPVTISIKDWIQYPEDTAAMFQETAPYLLQPGATFQDFTVVR